MLNGRETATAALLRLSSRCEYVPFYDHSLQAVGYDVRRTAVRGIVLEDGFVNHIKNTT